MRPDTGEERHRKVLGRFENRAAVHVQMRSVEEEAALLREKLRMMSKEPPRRLSLRGARGVVHGEARARESRRNRWSTRTLPDRRSAMRSNSMMRSAHAAGLALWPFRFIIAVIC